MRIKNTREPFETFARIRVPSSAFKRLQEPIAYLFRVYKLGVIGIRVSFKKYPLPSLPYPHTVTRTLLLKARHLKKCFDAEIY